MNNKKIYFIFFILIFLIIFVISRLVFLEFNHLKKDLIKSQHDFKDLDKQYINLKNKENELINIYEIRKYYSEVIKDLDSELLYLLDQKLNNHLDLIINQIPINFELNNGIILSKYNTKLLSGIHLTYPGSAFINIHENKIFLISSKGIIGSGELKDELNLYPIKSNIYDFINKPYFKSKKEFSIKDMEIINDKVYISYVSEKKEGCFNIALLVANLNFEKLNFKKFFDPEECLISNLDSKENKEIDYFTINQSGGRIVKLNDNEILITIGDFRYRYLAQSENSIFGKIIKVSNDNNGNYEIISMGHRNPQGLIKVKNKNILLSTEHGPYGGDEINLIELYQEKILNYGWPLSSYGEHYGQNDDLKKMKYKKYPLNKSHEDYGFIEPLKYHDPNYGISEITQINDNLFVYSSLKKEELIFFKLGNKNKSIEEVVTLNVKERVRDIKYSNNKLYLFLENSSSIGVIKIENPEQLG